MFDTSLNNQDLSVFSVSISTPPYNGEACGLSSEVLTPFSNIQNYTRNTSVILILGNELIFPLTDYSLEQKIIDTDYLIREKFSNFINNPDAHDLLSIPYGVGEQINLAKSLLQTQINEGFKNVEISIIDAEILGNANGAYAESLNTIFLADEFVKNNSTEIIAEVLTEEFGHFIDAKINKTDSAGDEGRIFAKLVFDQTFIPEELNSLKAEDDLGVIYYNNQFINIEKSELEIINDIGETLVINEDTTLVFQWTQREAKYNNEVGIIVFDNPEGKIDGVSPQDVGYFQKVLTSGKSEVIFAKGNSAGNWKQVDLKAGDYVGFYLIQNSSTSEYLNNPNSINIFSSVTSANTDKFDHVISTNLGQGVYRFNWEDLTGGGDKDFNDVVFNVFEKGVYPQGNNNQIVPLTVEFVSNDAGYRNEIGFYYVDDINGNINGISPTDANYAREVFKQDNYQVIFGEGNYNGVQEYNLTGDQYIGWYLISNNTSERFLQTNANNDPNGGVLAYFSYAEANPDKLNHLIHYSNNQMGWEDVLGLGDKDYNDLVFNFNFGNPRDINITVDDVSLTELDDENNVAEFKVRLSEPHLNPVTINYTTEDDTAISGEDYQTVAGSLTFLPGEIEKTIAVQVFGDDNEELDEVFNLKLTNVSNAVIVDGEAIATIINDDETINPPVNNSPVADTDKTISVEENSQPVELNINPPTDIDGDTLTITINQLPDNNKGIVIKDDGSQVNVNDSLTITELTNLIFTPVADASGNSGSFVYTVSDGKGGSDSQIITFNITTNNIVSLRKSNATPEFVSNPKSEIILGENYTYDANAVDEDNDTLFYSLLIAPEGLTIDNHTGVINWENANIGNHNISLLVEDSKGGQDRQDYSLNVLETAINRPPVFVSTPVVYGNINTEYRYEALASDADNDDLTYGVINAPEGLVINENTGVVTWTPTTLGEVEITLQVSDSKGGIATQTYQILVQEEETDNYAPVIISEAIVKASTSQNYVYDVNAIDPDADNLTYSLVTAPQGMTINESTGEIIWNTATQTIGNYDVTARVIDNRGGVDKQDFVIALNNNPLGTITGFKWEDANGNGFRDTALVQGDNPDVVFVLDVSGSADDPFAGSSIGDLNNDGLVDTRLDAEIAAFISLNQQLITQGLGTRANVAIVVFSGFSENADMDLVKSGVQLTTTPTADINNNGIVDVEEILRSITSGAFGVGNITGTNIEAALQKVEETFIAIGTKTGNGNLILLTDGESNWGGSITDEVERLKAKGFNLSAFGVGNDASLTEIQTIYPDAIKFTSTDELLSFFGSLEGEERLIESGLAGITVYLDLNNNGILDINEPSQITDETGKYQFTGLEAGTYIVREVLPTDYEQTYPGGNSNQGDGYADVILEFVSGGNAPSPLIEPYGSTGGRPVNSPFGGYYGIFVEPVNPNVILGAPPPSPIISSNPQVDWLALPTGSYVTVGFTDERIIDGPGDDIFIRSFDPEDSANEFADVYVSSNGKDFVFLGRVNENGLVSLDLATIGFTEPVIAVRVVGVDNLGASPGFDLIGVEVLPGSKVSSDFYTVQLAAGKTVNNINFGNKKIDQPIPNQAPVFTSTAPTTAKIGALLTYQATATDANNDRLTYSLLVKPEGMAVDSQTGILIWQPKQNQVGNNRVVLRVSDGKDGFATQEFILNTRAINTPPQIISSPNTVALLNNTYTYEVRATDPNNDTLTYSLINAIPGMTINANSGLIEYTPTQLGTQTVEIQVTDNFGGSNTQSYQLQVLENLSNRLPTITSTPQILIGSGNLYQYDVNATDPENTTITYGLTNKPDGMTIDANTGLISWQTQSSTNGDFQVTVSATDANGGKAYQNYYVKVFPNQNPVISSKPVELTQTGFVYEYDVIAGDVDGDSLTYTLTQAPTGLTIDPFGRLRWQPKTQDVGIYPITIKVDDGRGGIVTQNYNLTVTNNDIVKPVVNIGFSSNVINIGETVNLQVRATDNIGVETLNLTVDGTSLTLNPNVPNGQINNATFVGTNAGLYQFLGTARDEAGNIGIATIEVRVVDPSDTSAPIIEINTTNLEGHSKHYQRTYRYYRYCHR